MAEAAAGEGCLLVATGTPAVPPGRPLTVTPGERYERMAARWSSLVGGYDGMVCGCHIHVGVTGHAQALALANHMRPWLPTLQAIAANSPFSLGRDTGWASRRSVEWARWPGVGPAPLLDEAGYERLAGHLVRTGTLLDRRMIYWHARPSEHIPTLEIRVCDVNADLDVVVLLTALVRGPATSLLPDIGNGRPPGLPIRCPPSRSPEVAEPRGARTGCQRGPGPHGGVVRPVAALWGGAASQRTAHLRRGRLTDVVGELARTTAPA